MVAVVKKLANNSKYTTDHKLPSQSLEMDSQNSQNPEDKNDTGNMKAPDGGWGWVVVFAAFMIHVVADGVSYTFGLFFAQIVQEFQGSKSEASWIGSILIGVTFGTGPLANLLVNQYGCRAGTISGAIVAAFGFAISYFATSVFYLYVSIGVIGGLGLGLMFLPAIVCVSMYFEKKRSLATGIAVCGSGFGTFALAPLYDALISYAGWRLSLVAVSLTLLPCILCGMVFIPLESHSKETPHSDIEIGVYTVRRCSVDILSTPGTKETFQRGVGRKEKLGSKSTANLDPVQDGCKDATFCDKLKSWKGAALLVSPVFLCLAFSDFLTNVGMNIPYIYLADLAQGELKLEEKDPSLGYLVSSVGIFNTISRVVCGYISDQKWANRLYIYATALTLCGIAIAFSPMGGSLVWLYLCASVFGAMGGTYASLTSVIIVDLMGLDKLSNAFGIILLFQGVGTLLGPPIVGALYDFFGDYVYGFWVAGISTGISGLMLFFIPLIQRCEQGSIHAGNTTAPKQKRKMLRQSRNSIVLEML